MSTSKQTLVSEKALDNLLGQAFLNLDFNEPKNMELMETISTHHLVQTPSLLITLKKFFLNQWVIGTILIVLITSVIVVMINSADKSTTQQNFTSVNTSDQPQEPATETIVINPADTLETSQLPNDLPVESNSFNQTVLIEKTPAEQPAKTAIILPEIVKQKQDSAYIFPVLTEDEKKAHYKQKNKMLNALVKFNTDKYAYIPSGSCDYQDKIISVKAFYAQTTEVSNLEYRTFLSDLILQDRKQEFLAALPDESQWTKKMPYAYNEPMTNHYFSHQAYNNYPVVNIPREGAELFCKWLTGEANKLLKKNNKTVQIEIRIPDEYEWAYAAFNGKTRIKYANGNTYLRNSKGCYEINYVCHSLEECRYDSTLQLYLPIVDKHGYFSDGAFYPASVTSYLPNDYGLYCMAGNVSEMIVAHDSKQPATKGGSWFSCDHFLEIEAEDEHHGESGASPFIGFRPVVTMVVEE